MYDNAIDILNRLKELADKERLIADEKNLLYVKLETLLPSNNAAPLPSVPIISLVFDSENKTVRNGDKFVKLGEKEFKFLHCIYTSPDYRIDFEDLVETVWGDSEKKESRIHKRITTKKGEKKRVDTALKVTPTNTVISAQKRINRKLFGASFLVKINSLKIFNSSEIKEFGLEIF
jgi:hypothetical protein